MISRLFYQFSLLSLLILLLNACAPRVRPLSPWEKAICTQASFHARAVQAKFRPYFLAAGVQYPPSAIALLIFKNTRLLELWAKDKHRHWRYIRAFPILAASGGPGPKLTQGDHQVPEGIYQINELNPFSHFDLSLQLNYPNRFDRFEARKDGRVYLGNQVFIHGSHYSIGCIAIGNEAIEQLFVLAYFVGMENITVIIAPNDLRRYPPLLGRRRPVWLPRLYREIRGALKPFHM